MATQTMQKTVKTNLKMSWQRKRSRAELLGFIAHREALLQEALEKEKKATE